MGVQGLRDSGVQQIEGWLIMSEPWDPDVRVVAAGFYERFVHGADRLLVLFGNGPC